MKKLLILLFLITIVFTSGCLKQKKIEPTTTTIPVESKIGPTAKEIWQDLQSRFEDASNCMTYDCIEKVAIRTNDYTICEKILGPKTLSMPWLGRNHCYQVIAVKTNDPSLCEKIENLDIDNDFDKNYCKAIASRDISYCDKILIEDFKDDCNRSLKMDIAAKTEDISICEELGLEHQQYKFDCYTKVALFSNDETVCNNIPENENLASKIAHTECRAMVKEDPSICELLDSVVHRDNCFNKVAFVKQDISICDKIERSHIKIGDNIDAGCVEHIFLNIPFDGVASDDLRVEIY